MKDNTDRLFEAVEHPERFSDQELSQLLNDTETRRIYDAMSKTSDLMTATSEPDIDMEWKRFASTHRPRKRIVISKFIPGRQAAAAVIAIVASLAVVAATIGITHSWGSTEKVEAPAAEQSATDQAQPGEAIQEPVLLESTAEPEIKIFKEDNLEQIIEDICGYYGASATFHTAGAKTLRLYFQWDQSQPLDEVVEQLNSFEQIEITLNDNLITVE